MHTVTMELQAEMTAAAAVDVWRNSECVLKRLTHSSITIMGANVERVMKPVLPASGDMLCYVVKTKKRL